MALQFNSVLIFLALSVATQLCAASNETQIYMLSGTDKDHTLQWDFKVNGGRNSGEWKKIAVPSNWEMQGFGSYRYWNDWQTDPAPDTEGLYRTRFTVPSDWKDKQIEIVFGGVMTDTQVTLNGQQLGKIHQGGFYEFRYPVSAAINYGGINQLEVKVNRFSSNESVNRAERSGDFWLFSGIYRPVWLEAKPLDNIDHLMVDAKHTGAFSADIFLNLQQKTADKLTLQLFSLSGKKVGAPLVKKISPNENLVHVNAAFKSIIPWSAENPQRYRLQVVLESAGKPIHQTTHFIGFRTVELRKRDGLYVNGTKVRLKGANRHSIWPTSGRTTSKALSYQDVSLMKDMNMNAVRMSHYPPDTHFLDVADELGLYVIDELTGWQQAYNTAAGKPLVKEMVERDQHHPSILLWANGNEGGFNRDLDNEFAIYDSQQRPVIHPWENFGGIDTSHYETYDCCAGTFFHGRDVFMPTEFLHGLYDGGAGAGLSDWWNAMLANPLSAGGFIWAFADEGIVRDDRNGKIDVAGNRAPDGIVGPYREKEGSYFSIKKIWSPVYIPLAEQAQLPLSFDGSLLIENRYDFTNLKNVALSWKLVNFSSVTAGVGNQVAAQGAIARLDVAPGLRGIAHLDLPKNWAQHDGLYITATDNNGREIYTWSWMIANAESVAKKSVDALTRSLQPGKVQVVESADTIELHTSQLKLVIDRHTGYLKSLQKNNHLVPLSNGPRLVTGSATLEKIAVYPGDESASVVLEYSGNLRKIEWRLDATGVISLSYAYQMESQKRVDNLGVSFDYPESEVTGMRWLGKGPYRVWKNRRQGVEFNVWQKKYNDTVTGQSWVYPEFKGYHDEVYWAQLETRNFPVAFINHKEGVALRVFTPSEAVGAEADPKSTHVVFPTGDISFLDAIAPIGNKFDAAETQGPAGQPNSVSRLGHWYENRVDIIVRDVPTW